MESASCSTAEAARLLRVSIPTLKRMCAAGDVPYFKTPGGHLRFPVDGLKGIQGKAGGSTNSTPSSVLQSRREHIEELNLEGQEFRARRELRKLRNEEAAEAEQRQAENEARQQESQRRPKRLRRSELTVSSGKHKNADSKQDLLIRRDDLEERLLRRLREAVLREEVIDYAVERLRHELERRREELNSELALLRDQKQQHETEIARLVQAIATGKGGPSLTEAIAERERKIQQLTNRLAAPAPDSLQERLDELRAFAVSRLTNLRGLLSEQASVHEARALLSEQFGKFTLFPVSDSGKWNYKAGGSGRSVRRKTGTRGWCRGPELYITAAA